MYHMFLTVANIGACMLVQEFFVVQRGSKLDGSTNAKPLMQNNKNLIYNYKASNYMMILKKMPQYELKE